MALAGGCAAKPQEVIVKVPSFYDFTSARGALHAVADPYDAPDKANYIFDSSLGHQGFYPIHLIFENFGTEAYSLELATATLRYADGSRAQAVALEQLPRSARRQPLAAAFGANVLGGRVGPGETRSGFMFFPADPSGGSGREAVSLEVDGLVEEGTASRFDLAIPLQRPS